MPSEEGVGLRVVEVGRQVVGEEVERALRDHPEEQHEAGHRPGHARLRVTAAVARWGSGDQSSTAPGEGSGSSSGSGSGRLSVRA